MSLLLISFGNVISARAERRVALILGNSDYQHVPRLENPVNDANAMADLFRGAGFSTVTSATNLGLFSLRHTLADYEVQARDAEVAVVYYSGHGIEFRGRNYLIPIDAEIKRDVDVEDETVPLDRLLQAVSGATKLKLIILDACRTDPFLAATAKTKSVSRGLARVDPAASDELVAYAAQAGTVAADGNAGSNSPYTAALLRRLMTPGLDIELALRKVRDDVVVSTSGQQHPFYYGSMGGTELPLQPKQGENAQSASLPPAPLLVAPNASQPTFDPKPKQKTKSEERPSEAMAGRLYMEADSLVKQRRYKEAAAVLEKASALGEPLAQVGLGILYTTGIGGVPLNPTKAFELFKAAAAQGNAAAYGRLSIAYLKGLGTAQNIPESIRYAKIGVARNDPMSLDTLGHIYEDGVGNGSPDPCKAMKLYQRSADLKSGAAFFSIALLYVKGACVQKDMKRARHFLELSAAAGNPEAVDGLKLLHDRGL